MVEEKIEGKQEFREIVRVLDKDVSGNTSIFMAINAAKGAGFMMANAVCAVLGLDRPAKIGNLKIEDIDKIEDCLKNPEKYGIPKWMLNRRKDFETGQDRHLVGSDLNLQQQFDIRFLKKIRCWRGIRHLKNLKVRGQRTRTTGHKKGGALGVQRKKKGAPDAKPAAAPQKKEEKK